MDPERLLDGLDDAQREAVTSPANPLCVHAGAGSGKTRVLTTRVAHLILEHGASPTGRPSATSIPATRWR